MSKTIDLRKICLTAINSSLTAIINLLTGIKSKTDQLTFNGDKLKVDAEFSGTIESGPIEFLKNNIETNVKLDTVTPGNNEPLPVNVYNELGERGTQTNPFNVLFNRANTPAETTAAASVISITLIPANANRKQFYFYNASNKAAWVSANSPAIVGNGIKIMPDELFIEDVYNGALYAIWETGASGNYTKREDV